MVVRYAVVAVLMVVGGGCVDGDTVAEIVFTPRTTGSAVVPLSTSNEVALLAGGKMACVIDSYEDRVRCVDSEGTVTGVFGQKGEGPGEFGRPRFLVRGEVGTVGVVDTELGRFSIFEPSGTLVSDVLLPRGAFDPLSSFDTIVAGLVIGGVGASSRTGRGAFQTLVKVSIGSGGVVREEAPPRGPWDVDCGRVIYGIPDRNDGWVFLACGGYLVFVDAGAVATVVRAPTFVEELPNEWDMARRAEQLAIFNQGLERMGLSPSRPIEQRLETYRATPKRYYLSTRQRRFDATNRFWVATHRDLRESSYLDVYENAVYVGSVRVRDRLRGFDLLGSTLVVLVDRQVAPDDSDGIPDRALDWYDLGDFPSAAR